MVDRIKKDFEKIGLPTDVDIQLKGYSRTYEGRYIPSHKKIVLYHLANEEGIQYSISIYCTPLYMKVSTMYSGQILILLDIKV